MYLPSNSGSKNRAKPKRNGNGGAALHREVPGEANHSLRPSSIDIDGENLTREYQKLGGA